MIEREPWVEGAQDGLRDRQERIVCWACGLTFTLDWWVDACPGCDADVWPGREGG